MKRILFLGFAFLLLAGFAHGESDLEREMARLGHPEAEERLEALRALHTTLDPRLPDAMLSLLTDEGNSVRRLAARGIGSRWWQISKDRVGTFVAALQPNLESEFDDEKEMAQRAVGLLQRDYRGSSFNRSPNGRWVVYERYCLPCLIDTASETEELLGWDPERYLLAFPPGDMSDRVIWHPAGEMAAIGFNLNRRISSLWIWREGQSLRPISLEEMTALLKGDDPLDQIWFYATPTGWRGEDLLFTVEYSVVPSDADPVDYQATLGWNAKTDRLRLVSRPTMIQ